MRYFGLGAVALGALLAATPAMARDGDGRRQVSISPYIELSQVAVADLQNDDVLTYTSAAAGVDASIQTRRVKVNANVRYEHQFAWDKRTGDADVVSGLANAQVRVARGLTLDGGGIATRTRSGLGGPLFNDYERRDVSNLYSAYVGPTLNTGSGPIFLNAGYRFAYTKLTLPNYGFTAVGPARQDYFDDSKYQTATVSTGFKSGVIAPFGATLSAGWTRDDQSQLSSRFDGLYGRGDLVLPLSGTFAVEGGAGYEKITSSSKDPLLDANGNAVVDSHGRYVTDPASPRRIAYRTDGIYWDAGVAWRPSPRTSLWAHVGRRYGSWSYTGALSYAPSRSVGVQVSVYDTVETFGGQLQRGLRGLPTEFTTTRDLLAQQFSGCTFGTTGGGASGACLNSVFQAVSSATYRARGVDGTITASRGASTIGFGAGYSTRRTYAANTPGITVYGVTDESYYAQLFYSAPIGGRTTFNADVFANYYDPGFGTVSGVYSLGATGSLSRSFGRLGTTASLGIYNISAKGQQDETSAQAQVSAQYRF
ncbi:MAG: hypothetical protein J0I47_05550 [Sphingomonas sp.]|uniref:hypothetical protein n=1 Tax=Sphingomonas sp. TaxID=28214 RepID=UPI001AD46278|nr:hypothetical protein [Sphingomonas sp.]MBN8807687.1 hypothetical protein [Sphingomonas sp.]